MRLDFRKSQFDTAFEYADFGIFYDEDGNLASRSGKPALITKSGNFYTPPGYDKASNGMSQLCERIAGDEILQKAIFTAMMKAT